MLSWSPGESGSADASRFSETAVPARVEGRSESAIDTRFPPRDRCRRSFADIVNGLYNSSIVDGSADSFPVSSMKFFSFQRYEQGTFFGKLSFHRPDLRGLTLFSFLPCMRPRPLSKSFWFGSCLLFMNMSNLNLEEWGSGSEESRSKWFGGFAK